MIRVVIKTLISVQSEELVVNKKPNILNSGRPVGRPATSVTGTLIF